jgi:hypothetical protein
MRRRDPRPGTGRFPAANGSQTNSRGNKGLGQELANEAQRIAIDAEYLGRQHLIASEGWHRRVTLAAIPATALVAVLTAAGAGVAALVAADSRVIVVLAFVAAIASVARMLLRPDDEAAGHSIKGLQYLAGRADARRLRNIALQSARAWARARPSRSPDSLSRPPTRQS